MLAVEATVVVTVGAVAVVVVCVGGAGGIVLVFIIVIILSAVILEQSCLVSEVWHNPTGFPNGLPSFKIRNYRTFPMTHSIVLEFYLCLRESSVYPVVLHLDGIGGLVHPGTFTQKQIGCFVLDLFLFAYKDSLVASFLLKGIHYAFYLVKNWGKATFFFFICLVFSL